MRKNYKDQTAASLSAGPSEAGRMNCINEGLDNELVIWGYEHVKWKTVFACCGYVLTAGLLRLIFYWRPHWHLISTHRPCTMKKAEKVLIKDQYQQYFARKVIVQPSNPSASWGELKISLKDEENVMTDEQDLITDQDFQRYFMNKKLRYNFNEATQKFERAKGLDEGQNCSFFHKSTGLTLAEQSVSLKRYGLNCIQVHVKPLVVLLFTQALNPFYVFQLFSVIVWFCDVYYYYASCIVIMSAISLCTQVYQTRKMQRALKNTISCSSIVSVCRGNSEFVDISSEDLVPGDVIEVPRSGCVMQCDAVLVTGNCIVNESMLTGESVPVTKTPLPNPKTEHLFSMKEHSKHVLFCGTNVIQTRFYSGHKVKAVVIRTGFSTAKGELVRSIMYPKPTDFKFSQDAFKFVGVLFLIALSGMIYSVVLRVRSGMPVSIILLRSLDLITIVVPPALPMAVTFGIVFAQRRLKNAGIFCISPNNINQCGALDVVCFDKTGTLTEDGLDMWGVLPVQAAAAAVAKPCDIDSRKCHFSGRLVESSCELASEDNLIACMAACHSLTVIDGRLTGDPLDLKMFQFTDWELEEPGEDSSKYDVFTPTVVKPCEQRPTSSLDPSQPPTSSLDPSHPDHEFSHEIGIVRQFTFTSALQRMSVVTRTLGETSFHLYAKGAPEMITSLCKQETVPSDFHDVLQNYTQEGYRVLALAWRRLKPSITYPKVQRAQRDQLECQLTFLGLVVMENRIKPQTTPVIRQLKTAQIRTIMITGDNMLTALSVARDCSMLETHDRPVLVQVIPPSPSGPAQLRFQYTETYRLSEQRKSHLEDHDGEGADVVAERFDLDPSLESGAERRVHFVMTGKMWALLREYMPDMVPRIVLWGTVFARMSPEMKQQLVESLQELGYYVGMCGDGANDCGALKTAHAGISLSEAEASVASPFTSKQANISCVPRTISEGRAALVTSSGIFKYMAGYSLTQFITICLLYWVGATLTDFTFMYIDILLLTTLSVTFCYTGAYSSLAPKPPKVSLLSATPLLSFSTQLILNLLVQLTVFLLVQTQPWYVPFVPNEEEDYACHMVTIMFFISSFQYIILAVVFSRGPPYRKHIYTNGWFLANVIIVSIITVVIVVQPIGLITTWFELQIPPGRSFQVILVGMACGQLVLAFLVETLITDFQLHKKCWRLMCCWKSKVLNQPYAKLERQLLDAHPSWPAVSCSATSLADMMRTEDELESRGLPDVYVHERQGERCRNISTGSGISRDSKDMLTASTPSLLMSKLRNDSETLTASHVALEVLGKSTPHNMQPESTREPHRLKPTSHDLSLDEEPLIQDKDMSGDRSQC